MTTTKTGKFVKSLQVATLIFALTGCGQGNEGAPKPNKTETPSNQALSIEATLQRTQEIEEVFDMDHIRLDRATNIQGAYWLVPNEKMKSHQKLADEYVNLAKTMPQSEEQEVKIAAAILISDYLKRRLKQIEEYESSAESKEEIDWKLWHKYVKYLTDNRRLFGLNLKDYNPEKDRDTVDMLLSSQRVTILDVIDKSIEALEYEAKGRRSMYQFDNVEIIQEQIQRLEELRLAMR